MTYKVCIRPGCENPPRQFSTICNHHLNQHREMLHSIDRVASAHSGVAAAQKKLVLRIKDARKAGATWGDIGRAIGRSRQYAQRKFGPS